jgi:hypothetical protein
MPGWILPPPKKPTKTKEQFEIERAEKVEQLIRKGYLRSGRIKAAMLKVAREDFIPDHYRDYAYFEVPLPLPGEEATISCPHSYPLFYEPLGLAPGHRFLEIGLGSGYGTALAREIVGPEGLAVSLEIDPFFRPCPGEVLDQAATTQLPLGGFSFSQILNNSWGKLLFLA